MHYIPGTTYLLLWSWSKVCKPRDNISIRQYFFFTLSRVKCIVLLLQAFVYLHHLFIPCYNPLIGFLLQEPSPCPIFNISKWSWLTLTCMFPKTFDRPFRFCSGILNTELYISYSSLFHPLIVDFLILILELFTLNLVWLIEFFIDRWIPVDAIGAVLFNAVHVCE